MSYTIALPLIGLFDEYMWTRLHELCALIVFSIFMVYATWLSSALFKNIDRFPEDERISI
jgi:hypothetical protein